jgi:hypothetical protein
MENDYEFAEIFEFQGHIELWRRAKILLLRYRPLHRIWVWTVGQCAKSVSTLPKARPIQYRPSLKPLLAEKKKN